MAQAIIFDIGANVGAFAKAWRDSNKYNKIICVEANPNLIKNLTELFDEDEHIVIVNKLVSNVSGKKVDFYVNENHTLSTASEDWIKTSRFFDMYEGAKKIQVETITLDDLIKKYGEPRFIKIDVEGYELEVLHGLTKKQKDICFEWVEERISKTIECCKHLMEIGYKKFGYCLLDDYMKFPEQYTSFSEMNLMSKININKFHNWGNIFVK